MFNFFDLLRKLAKTNKYQALYHHAQDLSLQLFNNNKDLTDLQLYFLNYLKFYSNLYTAIAMQEVDKKVLDNVIYEDAYAYWQSEKVIESPTIDENTKKLDISQDKIHKKLHFNCRGS